jgi:phage replication O-like protein O
MANPQIEKGYTRIANEILENIAKANLNGTQFRILLTLLRYTYGFRRKEYEMPLAFIAKTISTTKGHANKEITTLIERGYIKFLGIGPRRGRILSFNKIYDEWDKPLEHLEQKEPKQPKSKPPKKPKFSEDNTYYKMAIYFHDLVSAVGKEAGVEHLLKKANLQSWADDFRKLIELDGVDKRLAKDVMDWVTQDPFWRTNVLSAKKFREKFGELAIKMKSSKNPKQPVKQTQLNPLDREIELQKWIQEGNDPDAFDYRK